MAKKKMRTIEKESAAGEKKSKSARRKDWDEESLQFGGGFVSDLARLSCTAKDGEHWGLSRRGNREVWEDGKGGVRFKPHTIHKKRLKRNVQKNGVLY